MPTVYGYARGSTNEQEATLIAQEQKVLLEHERRFKEKGYAWGGCFTDKGVSGSKRLRNRPQGMRLCLALEKGDVVIVTSLDRGFRNAMDFFGMLDEWARWGVLLVLLRPEIDTTTPAGRMMAGMLAVIAEFEREIIAQRTRDVNAYRKTRGRPCNQQPSYGYKLHGPKGKRVLVPDEYTRLVGAKILEWMEAGWTLDAIWRHLMSSNVKTRKNLAWSRSAIYRAYIGEMRLRKLEAERVRVNEVDTNKEGGAP